MAQPASESNGLQAVLDKTKDLRGRLNQRLGELKRPALAKARSPTQIQGDEAALNLLREKLSALEIKLKVLQSLDVSKADERADVLTKTDTVRRDLLAAAKELESHVFVGRDVVAGIVDLCQLKRAEPETITPRNYGATFKASSRPTQHRPDNSWKQTDQDTRRITGSSSSGSEGGLHSSLRTPTLMVPVNRPTPGSRRDSLSKAATRYSGSGSKQRSASSSPGQLQSPSEASASSSGNTELEDVTLLLDTAFSMPILQPDQLLHKQAAEHEPLQQHQQHHSYQHQHSPLSPTNTQDSSMCNLDSFGPVLRTSTGGAPACGEQEIEAVDISLGAVCGVSGKDALSASADTATSGRSSMQELLSLGGTAAAAEHGAAGEPLTARLQQYGGSSSTPVSRRNSSSSGGAGGDRLSGSGAAKVAPASRLPKPLKITVPAPPQHAAPSAQQHSILAPRPNLPPSALPSAAAGHAARGGSTATRRLSHDSASAAAAAAAAGGAVSPAAAGCSSSRATSPLGCGAGAAQQSETPPNPSTPRDASERAANSMLMSMAAAEMTNLASPVLSHDEADACFSQPLPPVMHLQQRQWAGTCPAAEQQQQQADVGEAAEAADAAAADGGDEDGDTLGSIAIVAPQVTRKLAPADASSLLTSSGAATKAGQQQQQQEEGQEVRGSGSSTDAIISASAAAAAAGRGSRGSGVSLHVSAGGAPPLARTSHGSQAAHAQLPVPLGRSSRHSAYAEEDAPYSQQQQHHLGRASRSSAYESAGISAGCALGRASRGSVHGASGAAGCPPELDRRSARSTMSVAGLESPKRDRAEAGQYVVRQRQRGAWGAVRKTLAVVGTVVTISAVTGLAVFAAAAINTGLDELNGAGEPGSSGKGQSKRRRWFGKDRSKASSFEQRVARPDALAIGRG